MPKLQAQAETAVRLLGYTPSANAYNAPQLTLTLAELKYQSPKDGVYVTRPTSPRPSAPTVQNSSRRYTGRYGASLNQRFGMAPNQATNSKLVSEVLSDALTRVFKDPTIAPDPRPAMSRRWTRKPGGCRGFFHALGKLRRPRWNGSRLADAFDAFVGPRAGRVFMAAGVQYTSQRFVLTLKERSTITALGSRPGGRSDS